MIKLLFSKPTTITELRIKAKINLLLCYLPFLAFPYFTELDVATAYILAILCTLCCAVVVIDYVAKAAEIQKR